MKKNVLKTVAMLLAVTLTFVVVQLTVFGNQSAVADSDYTFSVDGNNATITGCNVALSGAVMLPSSLEGYTVTGIGEAAFKDYAEVTCFFLPDTLTDIGKYAFEGCTALLNASFPASLATVGEGAYWECSSLVSVTLPESVASVGSCAFYGCTSLESLVVLGTELNISGVFNVQLDIGEVVAIGSGVFALDNEVQTVVYCYNGSAAYYDALRCTFCSYTLLDECTLTSYTVSYVDAFGAELYPEKQFSIQPASINIAEVAANIDGYDIETTSIATALSTDSTANNLVFTYELLPETTTEEPTTEEPTTEEPTTEEPTTEEPTTEEPTTEEPTTEEPTTEEPTEPPVQDIELVAANDSTAQINDVTGYITGIATGTTYLQLANEYLQVIGNGHIECSSGSLIGTGSVISLLDESNQLLAYYTIVIYGDLNGDGLINMMDQNTLAMHISGGTQISPDSATFFASDISGDGLVNQTDSMALKTCLNGSKTVNQSTGTAE